MPTYLLPVIANYLIHVQQLTGISWLKYSFQRSQVARPAAGGLQQLKKSSASITHRIEVPSAGEAELLGPSVYPTVTFRPRTEAQFPFGQVKLKYPTTLKSLSRYYAV